MAARNIMRITSGIAGGIPLKVPDAVARPTTDRVRQALFNMLAPLVPGARVLDLFAGSGALGLEALSRGAKSALLVDEHRAAIAVMRENIAKAKLPGATVRQGDALRLIDELVRTQTGAFDLILADPPYAHHPKDKDFGKALLASESLPLLLSPGGSLVLECLAGGAGAGLVLPAGWVVERDRAYGSTRVLWLRRAEEAVAGNPEAAAEA